MPRYQGLAIDDYGGALKCLAYESLRFVKQVCCALDILKKESPFSG